VAIPYPSAEPIQKRILFKPDGREVVLYGRAPLDEPNEVPQAGAAGPRESHVRWHPLRGEWVVYARQRQHRTYMPAGWDPLAPTTDPTQPTELPTGNWEVAVFENLFSSLGASPDLA
jgi:UDPglucose--hexose-1-phosphate uridylyltransferase